MGRSREERRSESPIDEEKHPPFAPEVDLPPDPAGELLVRGRAFFEKVRRLLWQGVAEPGTRHDAVLTLAGYHLVNIRLVSAEVRRDVDGETVQGIARLRAITEPL